jgi:hypothetical protein
MKQLSCYSYRHVIFFFEKQLFAKKKNREFLISRLASRVLISDNKLEHRAEGHHK